MPFIPHTQTDISTMLDAIGVASIDDLFDEIPAELRHAKLTQVPTRSNEMAVSRLMSARAAQDGHALCFIGAGAYEHHIPAAVWELTTRGEFYSAYTPYQAEASQGTLQLLYEFQSMMASLTGMDVSNASLYDGASALAEAVLMAVRINRNSHSRRILIASTVHPVYRKVVQSIVKYQGIELTDLPYCTVGGHILPESLKQFQVGDFAALVIAQPNFFGVLEEVDALTDWAHAAGALVIASVNPVSLAILKPPGEWGGPDADNQNRGPDNRGADIVCGEGQPLGAPLSSGGPYFGFMCCKQDYVRQMPGRIVGRTVDMDGKPGFTLTLQAREQHIRRSKATSNICTNQGLLVTAATIFMSLLGPDGLARVAAECHANTLSLLDKLTGLPGVTRVFDRPLFHEAVIRVDAGAASVLREMQKHDILAGLHLSEHFPELGNAILFCATETRTAQDIDDYVHAMQLALSACTDQRITYFA